MGKLLIIGISIWLGFMLVNRLGLLDGPLARSDGSAVKLEADDLDVTYRRVGGPTEASFMVFGGDADHRTNQMTHATMATLSIEHAKRISRLHPDFHRCASPGAASAKNLVESTSFVATDSAARRGLAEAVRLHAERVGSGGDRTCVTVEGSDLELERVLLKDDGSDITRELPGALTQGTYRLAERVTIRDCAELLR